MNIGNVLSLFDGVSCGQIALQRSGITYGNYFASEVDKHAIKVTQTNFPNTIQLGDVTKITGDELPHINLLIGGFPCQDFSIAGKRAGLEGDSGKLFFELLRLKNKLNPDYFLFENNQSMKREIQIFISEKLGIYPVRINSKLVSAQNRDRIYWTNFRTREMNLFGDLISDIPQPKDRKILLRDILEKEVDEKYYISEKALARIMRKGYSNPQINPDKTETVNTKNNSGQLSVDSGTTLVKINVDGNPKRNQDKASCFSGGAHSGGAHSDMDLIKEVSCVAMRGHNPENPSDRTPGIELEQTLEERNDEKTNTTTSVQKDNLIREVKEVKQLLIGKSPDFQREKTSHKSYAIDTQNKHGIIIPHQQDIIQSPDAAARTLVGGTHGNAQHHTKTIINERIRRLTEIEVCRLQTIPDDYFLKDGKPIVSSTQIYKAVGNGWTIDVICHILFYLPLPKSHPSAKEDYSPGQL